MTNDERILLDDSREDTHGCSRATWEWYCGMKLLGKLGVIAVAVGLVIWFLAKQVWS